MEYFEYGNTEKVEKLKKLRWIEAIPIDQWKTIPKWNLCSKEATIIKDASLTSEAYLK